MATIAENVKQTPARVLPARDTRAKIGGYIAISIVVVATVVIALNPNFRWPTVAEFLFDPNILIGIVNTVLLTIAATVCGTVIGALLALMKLSKSKQLYIIAEGYIWIFRGVPLLVQLLLWFNLAALFPATGVEVPGLDISLEFNANQIISPFMAAFLAFSLHEGAYMAEIIRSGISSIDSGQWEAAGALAMNSRQRMSRIILPQALRVIVPPTGNQVITMLKTTSLVSVIALNDLLYSAQIIYSNNYQVIPLLLVASIWYLVMVTILTAVQIRLERRLSRGRYVSNK
ncbi:amino acid ABC transporter permease [Corynebacterium frankenforstense]|uniref:amino acid ABC transporter permease n=1 Tax=Corynebacterium TaxID=1716 RepID=UPI00254C0877|nr:MULTISPECIES: amino acid ABC transporter permease [Corynebacterium]MDK6259633.1 amino acid ABC transporter permease [Corynebacterium frankenforstense]MDK8894831.1 amino acid ABC transporter permease [Corynebacterium sp. MSK006]